jgi:hypothetical protein
LQAAITSGRLFEISLSAPRVASERMNTRLPAIAFMRMRSPSSAPPDFLREGSTARMAISSRSSWSAEAAHQLIGERGFSRTSGARHPEHRYGAASFSICRGVVSVALLERGDQSGSSR